MTGTGTERIGEMIEIGKEIDIKIEKESEKEKEKGTETESQTHFQCTFQFTKKERRKRTKTIKTEAKLGIRIEIHQIIDGIEKTMTVVKIEVNERETTEPATGREMQIVTGKETEMEMQLTEIETQREDDLRDLGPNRMIEITGTNRPRVETMNILLGRRAFCPSTLDQ